MIARIKGKIREKRSLSVLFEAGDITYEILIPPAVMFSLGVGADDTVELVVYHYYQVDPSRSFPVMIGFTNEIERDFFEKFITVSGVGPKAACKALTVPFSTIAGGIDRGDEALLKSLPGIGERKAREIIAKLQGKVGKYCLIQDKGGSQQPAYRVKDDIKAEAVGVLLQLQYKKKEAEEMVEKALARNGGIRTSEDVLNEVYKSRGSQ